MYINNEDFEKWMERLSEILIAISKDLKILATFNNVTDDQEKNRTERTLKVTSDVLIQILQKAGISTMSDDKAKIARLIGYLTAFSEEKIRQRLSNPEELTSYHKDEVENINKILKELNANISVVCNNKR
jgi:Zn-dependent oligopeptidase